ncbi:unnamed protein product, partial [Rotaria sp. Silwood1]
SLYYFTVKIRILITCIFILILPAVASSLVPPPPPPAQHHPAFPFNPYSWINFASRTDFQQIYSSTS